VKPAYFVEAIQCFGRAIAKDPQYALAQAELANAIGTARFFGYLPPDQSDQPPKVAIRWSSRPGRGRWIGPRHVTDAHALGEDSTYCGS
jgi:hypothetical protein